MRYRSIEFHNFRQYRGHQKVEFSCNPEKPLTVILGQNTSGKTTFVRAFTWCLYGGEPEDLGFKKDTLFLNENESVDLEKNPSVKTKEASVTLIVDSVHGIENVENEFQYRLQRKQTFFLNSENRVSGSKPVLTIYQQPMKNGKIDPSKNENVITDSVRMERIINSIIPEDLSEYFFYWGEKIVNVGNRSDIQNAIESITGLELYSRAVDDLKVVRGMYRNSIIKHDNEQLDNLNRQRDEQEKLKKSEVENLKILEKNYIDAKKTAAKAEADFYALTDLEFKLEEKKRLLAEKKKLEAELESSYAGFYNAFNNKRRNDIVKNTQVPLYFVQEKAKELIEMVQKSREQEDVIGFSKISADMIEEIIHRGVCICGRDVKDHPDVVKHLKEQIPLAIPNSIGGYVGEIEGRIKTLEAPMTNYVDQLYSQMIDYKKKLVSLEDVDARIEVLEREQVDEKEYEFRKNKKNETSQLKQSAYANQVASENKVKDYDTAISQLNRRIDKAIEQDKQHTLVSKKLKLTTILADRFKNLKEEKIETIREELKKYAQMYFSEMYQGERRIDFTKTFMMRVYNTVDGERRENETSPGLETVKNFAFVAALITIASKKYAERSNSDHDGETGEPYPLVLDAPFSQVDAVHIMNICKLLCEISKQTILVVMEKDWKVAEEELGKKIGVSYEIDKMTETLSDIKEVKLVYGG